MSDQGPAVDDVINESFSPAMLAGAIHAFGGSEVDVLWKMLMIDGVQAVFKKASELIGELIASGEARFHGPEGYLELPLERAVVVIKAHGDDLRKDWVSGLLEDLEGMPDAMFEDVVRDELIIVSGVLEAFRSPYRIESLNADMQGELYLMIVALRSHCSSTFYPGFLKHSLNDHDAIGCVSRFLVWWHTHDATWPEEYDPLFNLPPK